MRCWECWSIFWLGWLLLAFCLHLGEGYQEEGKEDELSVCIFVLLIEFSTCVWSASGACSWIWKFEALRKRLDHKSITIDHNSWVRCQQVVITVTDVNAVAQQRAEWGEGKGQPRRTLTSSGRAGKEPEEEQGVRKEENQQGAVLK